MMDFFPHPTDPNLVVLKATARYIGKHSDEDLKAAVLAEREACAKVCESRYKAVDFDDFNCANEIRARGDK
jgi:hypothetical protein